MNFVKLREDALYVHKNRKAGLSFPQEIIGKDLSREILLLAIESVDDRLVGWTNCTFDIEMELDNMLHNLVNS